MNQRATVSLASLPVLVEPSKTPAPSEGVAKPKIMRRPAQFSKPAIRHDPAASADTRIEANAATSASTAPHTPALRPWQDDARFAFALLAIVIIVNLALSVWLAPKTTVSPAASPAPIALVTPIAEPALSKPESLIYHLNEAGASVSEQ